MEQTQLIELNVGGKHITTFLSTLTKEEGSRLARMFSPGQESPIKDKKGRYFIDCNSEMFEQVLEFLRSGSLPSEEKASSLYKMAEDLGIHSLSEKLRSFRSVKGMIKVNEVRRESEYEVLRASVLMSLNQCLTSEDIMINLGDASSSARRGANNEAQMGLVSVEDTWKFDCIANVRPTEDAVAGLVEELHALGYGKHIYITSNQYRCRGCGINHAFTLLMSTHKIIQCLSEGRIIYKQI